jgi:hypothetical protein
VMMVRSLEAKEVLPRLTADDVVYWRRDIF